jgi:hypothetical protein
MNFGVNVDDKKSKNWEAVGDGTLDLKCEGLECHLGLEQFPKCRSFKVFPRAFVVDT